MHILLDQLGYELQGPKRAILQLAEKGDSPGMTGIEGALPQAGRELGDEVSLNFELRGLATGRTHFSGRAGPVIRVPGWRGRRFRNLDFDGLRLEGSYHLTLCLPNGSPLIGGPLSLTGDPLADRAIPDLLFHIKSMRASGCHDRADRLLPFFGGRPGRVDVHGGWQDAAGDLSKYLSHLGYAQFFAPQQTPLVVWALLEAASRLAKNAPSSAASLSPRFTDEILHGADFLMRMQDPEGWFYTTVFDQWSWDPARRMICSYRGQNGERLGSYRAAYRNGGGLAVAALARASTLPEELWSGEYTANEYLRAATKGFATLERRNLDFLADSAAAGNAGEGAAENIIDDYCALLAAVELYAASGAEEARRSGLGRVASLAGRIRKIGPLPGWWDADGRGRPYYHAVEAGLPALALLRARSLLGAEADLAGARAAVEAALGFELAAAAEANPFGLARQYGAALNEEPRLRFFIPHRNETGYWWQGENARLASLAAASFAAAAELGGPKAAEWKRYGRDQLRWISGRNPFDVCMIQGLGWNTPTGESGGHNAPGGIMNGITAGFHDETDLAFLPPGVADDPGQRWRWVEQWLPHAAWFILAASAMPRPGR